MNVIIINKSDSTGGAAVVSFRLMQALRSLGINAEMLVCEKLTDSPYVHLAASPPSIKSAFLAERLKIYLANGFNRADLFKVDSASDGLPLHRHPLVKQADVICLNWVNQGMLSLRGLQKLQSLGKPIFWTMHDMWCMTGICHHAGTCLNYHENCGECQFLGSRKSRTDLSHRVLEEKLRIYRNSKAAKPIHFVAVSRWLAELGRKSALLADATLSVIPNAFPTPDSGILDLRVPDRDRKFRVLMGAARLDDPVKGLPILVEATRQLKLRYPALAARTELVTFGNLRNPAALDCVEISHRHLGPVHGADAVRDLYLNSDCVVSTSLYETLPGTLVEGQFYGAVPVSFGRGGQADIIDNRSTGWIAEWSDDVKIAGQNIAAGLMWASEQGDQTRSLMLASATARFAAESVAKRYIELFQASILA
ncbi:MAG: glycosyltransferase [Muribaculaceae bacterium]|nr:glycosyltransferase [Muribaculaceae bacterium]